VAHLSGFPALLWISASLAGLLCVGLWCRRRIKGTTEFYLANRKIPSWAAGISLVSSELSVMTLLSLPAEAYGNDLRFLQFFAGSVFGRLAVAFLFLPFFYATGGPSIFSRLRGRFGPLVQAVTAGVFCAASLLGCAVRLMLACAAVSMLTGFPPIPLILIASGTGAVYMALGGISAVIWGGVLQVALIAGAGVAFVMFLGDQLTGGIGDMLHVAREAGRLSVWARGSDGGFGMTAVGGLVGAMIAFGVDQDRVQRLLCVSSKRRALRALLASIPIGLAVSGLFLAAGTALFLYYEQHPELALPMRAGNIVGHFIVQVLPVGVGSVFLAAVLMSSIDAPLVGITTAMAMDILPLFRRSPRTKAGGLRQARLLVLAAGAAVAAGACFLLVNWDWIELAFKASGVIMSPVLGLFLIRFLTRWRAPRSGALAVGGMAVLGLWLLLWYEGGQGLFGLSAILVAGTLGTAVLIRVAGPTLDGRKFWG